MFRHILSLHVPLLRREKSTLASCKRLPRPMSARGSKREKSASQILSSYPKFAKIAMVAICTTSALTLSGQNNGMLFAKSTSVKKSSSSKSKSLFSSIKMMVSGKSKDSPRPRNVLALDFDGVVCASSVESSFSSIVAAEKFWPGICEITVNTGEIDDIDSSSTISSYSSLTTEGKNSLFCRIRAAVNELRPIVETGFENMLLVRTILEEVKSTGEIDTAALMQKWSPNYRDELIVKYGTSKEELVNFFGKTRDELIAENTDAWIRLNRVYPCVLDCLGDILPKKLEFTVITTKQERFVTAILERNLITPPSKENIYDLENPYGAKTQVLAALLEKYKRENTKKETVIHFVEDRFETLQAVMRIPALNNIQLYLVDWGYNTQSQREEAAKLYPRIKLINGEEFKELAVSFIR